MASEEKSAGEVTENQTYTKTFFALRSDVAHPSPVVTPIV
jgi:hypothetical protein